MISLFKMEGRGEERERERERESERASNSCFVEFYNIVFVCPAAIRLKLIEARINQLNQKLIVM